MTIDGLWRVLRRLLFLCVTLVVAANTIAFVLLNNGLVHDFIRDGINEQISAEYGLVVEIGTLSLNVLEVKVNVDDIVLKSQDGEGRQLARIGKATLGLKLFASADSWLPQPQFFRMSDWTLDLALAQKIKSSDDPKELKIEEMISAIRRIVGSQVEVASGQLTDSRANARLESLQVDNVFLRIGEQNRTPEVSVIAQFGPTVLCIRPRDECFAKSKVDAFKVNAVYRSGVNIRFEQMTIAGDFGHWTAVGEFQLNPVNEVAGYSFRVQGDSGATPWFSLAGMQGQGQFGANFRLTHSGIGFGTESALQLDPLVEGKIHWKDLNLSGFDIYAGSADISYSNRTLRYKNAQIITNKSAVLEAFGEYSFENTKQYFNHVKFYGFSFSELMRGLRVPTDAIDFLMETKSLVVRGEISPKSEKGYSLIVEGAVSTNQLVSPSFETGQRRLPNCEVGLKLDTDRRRMTFQGSTVNCTSSESGAVMPVELQKGRIDYLNGTTQFDFTATNAPSSIVSYFVGIDISGSLNFRARIASQRSTSPVFTADVQANDGKVFDLEFSRVSTRLRLDKNRITCSQTEAWLNNERQSPNLTMKNFELEFRTKKLSVEGGFDGELADFLAAAGTHGAKVARQFGGQLKIREMSFRGLLSQPEKAEMKINAVASNVDHPTFNSKSVKVVAYCQLGLCTGSRVFARDIALGQARLPHAKQSGQSMTGLISSSAIFELDSFTGRSLSLRTSIVSVPFQVRLESGSELQGQFDFKSELQGGWKDWELAIRSRIDSLTLDGVSLGSVDLTGSSVDGGALNLVVAAMHDQIQTRLVFDHDFSEFSQVYLSARSFDVLRYVKLDSGNTLQPVAVFSGDLSLNAPGLNKVMRSFRSSVRQIQGQGEIYAVKGQLSGESFSNVTPTKLGVRDGELTYSPILIQGKNFNVRSSGRYNFLDSQLTTNVATQADASLLAGLVPGISQADGEIRFEGDLRWGGRGSKISGQAQLTNVSLGGPYLTPPILGVNGRINIQDSRLEIPAITGSKGNGQVELVGTIDFNSPESSRGISDAPSIAIRTNVRSAQLRIPQDLFETVEATVDGQIELVGRGAPYLLNGDIEILKGRAFRDATCQELLSKTGLSSGDSRSVDNEEPQLQLNLNITADNSLTLQTSCLRGRVSAGLKLTGYESSPVLAGQIRIENGQLNLLKTRFEVSRADALFDNLVRIEPRLEAQMVAKIDRYSVFVGADGPLSRPRLNIWSDPSTAPDGTPLTRAALIRMISTNRAPGDTTQTAVTQAIANGVVGLFDDPLSQAVSRITRGFVDRFELQPILESGQSSWRARVSRELGEKFNLGLDIESNSQSLTGEIFINESVNILGGFDRRSSQVGSYSELKGGFRFQFGGN